MAQKVYIRNCKHCNKELEVHRCATVVICQECRERIYPNGKRARKTNVVRQCIGCGKDVKVKKARATMIYCSKCKREKEKQRRKKLQRYNNRKIFRTCYICNCKEEVDDKYLGTNYTCKSCLKNPKHKHKYKRNCKLCDKEVIVKNRCKTTLFCDECEKIKDDYKIYKRNNKSYRICFKCKKEFEISPKSRCYKCNDCLPKRTNGNRPKFAKKKHFGYYGIASDGHRWDSLNEQDIEEWLIYNGIEHKPHPRLGKTLRHSDQFLIDKNIYIEIDGLNREDDLDWDGKLSLYKKLKLKFKIIKPPSTHYHEDREKCFEELDKTFSFLK